MNKDARLAQTHSMFTAGEDPAKEQVTSVELGSFAPIGLTDLHLGWGSCPRP
jgi:hypothetical protein